MFDPSLYALRFMPSVRTFVIYRSRFLSTNARRRSLAVPAWSSANSTISFYIQYIKRVYNRSKSNFHYIIFNLLNESLVYRRRLVFHLSRRARHLKYKQIRVYSDINTNINNIQLFWSKSLTAIVSFDIDTLFGFSNSVLIDCHFGAETIRPSYEYIYMPAPSIRRKFLKWNYIVQSNIFVFPLKSYFSLCTIKVTHDSLSSLIAGVLNVFIL